MDRRIDPGPLNGSVQAIASKSELHRMLICAAFAESPTELLVSGSPYDGTHALPNDMLATIRCLRALGAEFEIHHGSIRVTPADPAVKPEAPLLDCGESGSTFRFLLPVAAAFCGDAAFSGSGRLPERPITDLADVLEQHGVAFSSRTLPFSIHGKPAGGIYEIPGNISSQYLTGLLLMLPLLGEKAEIRLTTPLVSSGYIDITTRIMEDFGVRVKRSGNIWKLYENKPFTSPSRLCVGGDWSNTAAFLTASMLRKDNAVCCQSLLPDSPQGDRKILSLLEAFGAETVMTTEGILTKGGYLHGTEIDIDETPDLLPVLAIAACAAKGTTRFTNAARLRLKESDRIESVAALVRDMGGTVETTADSLTVHGTGFLRGGTVDAANDHRIVMAAAIAASLCESPVVIRGAEAVSKSYPTFFEDLAAVKGVSHVL